MRPRDRGEGRVGLDDVDQGERLVGEVPQGVGLSAGAQLQIVIVLAEKPR